MLDTLPDAVSVVDAVRTAVGGDELVKLAELPPPPLVVVTACEGVAELLALTERKAVTLAGIVAEEEPLPVPDDDWDRDGDADGSGCGDGVIGLHNFLTTLFPVSATNTPPSESMATYEGEESAAVLASPPSPE